MGQRGRGASFFGLFQSSAFARSEHFQAPPGTCLRGFQVEGTPKTKRPHPYGGQRLWPREGRLDGSSCAPRVGSCLGERVLRLRPLVPTQEQSWYP